MSQDVALLRRCLDRMRPGCAHTPERSAGCLAEFDQQASCHGACTAESPTAVDQDPAAIGDHTMQLRCDGRPASLKTGSRRIQVCDRQVVPLQATLDDAFTEVRNTQGDHLVSFDKRQDRGRPPGLDDVEIETDIAGPRCAEHTVALLAGTEGDADRSRSYRKCRDV